jgi:23S rRNA (uracil1939-C5)-methyltransferase
MPYDEQLKAKKTILRDQLERIGKLKDPPIHETIPAHDPWDYRNHVQFHLTQNGQLGYHQARSDEVFPIQECHLPAPTLNTVWPQLDFENITKIDRIGLRLGVDDDVQLILESNDLTPPEMSIEDLPISAVHISPAGSLVLAGSPTVVIEVLERPFRVSAGSFFQTNTAMAQKMVTHLLDYLKNNKTLNESAILLDAYCGVGLFSAFLAPKVGRLIGIEISPSATEDFEYNLDEFDNVELYEASVKQALPGLSINPDVIIVDPPRAGIDREAMDNLINLAAPLLVYISCDPATLARDTRRLTAEGYHLEQVTPFDLFPQTYHIESISFWKRQS